MVTQLSHAQMSGFRPRDDDSLWENQSLGSLLSLPFSSLSSFLQARPVFLVESPMHINYLAPRLSFWIIRNLIHTSVHPVTFVRTLLYVRTYIYTHIVIAKNVATFSSSFSIFLLRWTSFRSDSRSRGEFITRSIVGRWRASRWRK